MFTEILTKLQRKPTPACTLALYVFLTGAMMWLRFEVLRDHPVNIGYGLPLLVCVWYPNRRLLWGLMGTYAAIAVYKIFVLHPEPFRNQELSVWVLQMVNMLVIGVTVLAVIDLLAKLRGEKGKLEEINQELVAREEEITRQNEELQSQSEELQQQNEEIQQQAEELQAQSEELQITTQESLKRQAILQALLDSLNTEDSGDLPEHVCQLLMALLGDVASAAVVLEQEGDDLVVLAQAGPVGLPTRRWAFENSFASVVMTHDRTAFVRDLQLRPDLKGSQSTERIFRSVLATPLRVGGKPAGVIKVFALSPHDWTKEQFKIVEWMAAQCALLMESRRLKQELQQNNQRLDGLVKERTAELQDLVNELEHFSYTITHDLRAPLRAMHGFAGLLAEECMDTLNEQCREYLRRITTAAGRMDRLIMDALSYSKVVRHQMPMEPVDMGRLLHGMIESYPIFQLPKADVQIDGTLPAVMGNEAGLTQCLSNLLGNAVKFMPPGRTPIVRIRAERRGERVRVWCEDNGIGIPAEMQARVFVMFQRLSKDYEGTGIGLALVKKVVERMGGAVGVESEPGKGSRFWIELLASEPSHP